MSIENLSAAEIAGVEEDDFEDVRDEFTAAEFYGEMFAAQYDDDPSPYSGDYSEM